MQCSRYLWPILTSPRIPTSAAIEIAYFLLQPWLQLVGGVLYFVCGFVLVSGLVQAGSQPLSLLNPTNVSVLALFLLFGMGPLVVWGPVYRLRVNRRTSRKRALMLGLANAVYLYVNHIAVWSALWRIVRSRNDWAKTDRNRPTSPIPSASVRSVARAA